MISDSRMTDYLHSLESDQGCLLDEIEKKAVRDRIPIIRRETAALLRTLIYASKPGKILEIGTAVGYSALMMCQAMPQNGRIVTIEKYEKRIEEARKNFLRAGVGEKITLMEGDADHILDTLSHQHFDLIFMDAAKGQYLGWLPKILPMMEPGALLISDNVLQDGDVIQSRFAIERRNRTIHSRMREYLYELKHCPLLETAILTVGDGVALSARKERIDL